MSLIRRLVAVLSQWIPDYTALYIDNTHDCYILEFNSTKRKLVPSGTYSNSTDRDVDFKDSKHTPVSEAR